MATDAWHPSEDDIEVVITWLRDDVAASAPGSWQLTPRLHNVRCTHLEDGWVNLTFMDWPLSAARAVADRLLHPDALLVRAPGGGIRGHNPPAFEGFGWDEEPPAAVLARHRRSPGPDGGELPQLEAAEASATSSTTSLGAVDWEGNPS